MGERQQAISLRYLVPLGDSPCGSPTLSFDDLSSGPGFEDCSEGSRDSFSPGVLPFIFRVCVLKTRNRQQVIGLCFGDIRICSL